VHARRPGASSCEAQAYREPVRTAASGLKRPLAFDCVARGAEASVSASDTYLLKVGAPTP